MRRLSLLFFGSLNRLFTPPFFEAKNGKKALLSACGDNAWRIHSAVYIAQQARTTETALCRHGSLRQEAKLLKLSFPSHISFQFWALLLVLFALLSMGGASRADTESLAILNPLMAVSCGVALMTLKKDHWRNARWPILYASVVFVTVVMYLISLPFPTENMSPGLRELADIRILANVTDTRQTLSVSPSLGWQSLFSLFAPLSVFLLAIQLSRYELNLTLPVVIILVTISIVFGILQLYTNRDNIFYIYSKTNYGSPVGLLANRNHAALFMCILLPMLSAYLNKLEKKYKNMQQIWLFAFIISAVVIPLILITGSRSGIFLLIIGFFGAILILKRGGYVNGHKPKSPTNRAYFFAYSGLGILVLVTAHFSRAEGIERLFENSMTRDVRGDYWRASAQLFKDYFPLGLGPGAFGEAFKTREPIYILTEAYVNRLHNDWLETILTYGISGCILVIWAVIFFIHRTIFVWRKSERKKESRKIAHLASIIIAMFASACFSDYPIRTPLLGGCFSLFIVWFISENK